MAGHWVDSRSGESLTIRNPIDDSIVVSNVQVAGQEDVDDAVAAATAAFKTGPWSTFSGTQRAACMFKFADLVEQNIGNIATLETLAMGQPISISRFITTFLINSFRYYAGLADKIGGEMYPEDGDGLYKLVRYEPLGVCAGLAAWNTTMMFLAHKLAPALASGNTFIFKTSEKSPLGVLAVAPLLVEAGFPPGVVNLVSGAGNTGHLLSSHMGVAKVSFTGSGGAGRKVQKAAAESNLKRVTLELGGKSPALVFKDADIENALGHCSSGFLLNSGQVCAAASRAIVHEDIAPQFITALKAQFEAASATLGADPMEPTTILGPLPDQAQLDSVMSFIEQGKKDAELIVGGNRKGETGWFVEPTIFFNPPTESQIWREEIFGPVLCVRTFSTEEEAIELANDTVFGLSAAIYTSSLTRALRVSARLETGTVAINTTFVPNPQAPFGGTKQSGIGRESGKQGLMAYVESKTVQVNMNTPERDDTPLSDEQAKEEEEA
ncbi:MAG: hypothetical protein M1827_000994 [Pycnora praestabilis]|nr:MAG: hypothetical protein M1827_000994 [Pycnora praestabilis]